MRDLVSTVERQVHAHTLGPLLYKRMRHAHWSCLRLSPRGITLRLRRVDDQTFFRRPKPGGKYGGDLPASLGDLWTANERFVLGFSCADQQLSWGACT